ncbi:MAG: triose-phosphate isomerase [Deltaproteobacteria bacterium]|nr:triose-phosphate isomerase [Deltaproteobacteria bacterium]
MSKTIVGNWKMNGSLGHIAQFVPALRKGLPQGFAQAGGVVGLCPPFPYLAAMAQQLQGSDILLGGQNVYPAVQGAFTGEVSPGMLKELGASLCIIGHSERRELLKEDDAFVRAKLQSLLAEDITPILCVGETLAQREGGRQEEVVSRQLNAALQGLDVGQAARLTIAYEPIWAIGTGKTASPQQANEMHSLIRSLLATLFGPVVAPKIDILYGGSVNPGNAASLLSQPEVNGALVGGASLKAEDFLAILAAAPLTGRA